MMNITEMNDKELSTASVSVEQQVFAELERLIREQPEPISNEAENTLARMDKVFKSLVQTSNAKQ
ncbi:MAG: hypothetical protein MJ250_08725 [Alphaproteobacteria bacterium]|nr:hypothetical protein [Alphaproteobacteria bacterium]